VITTPFTWISTAEVIAAVGATPVFVDIEPDTFNIDPRAVAAAITARTRAILPVSLFGQLPDLVAINALAAEHGLPVIEDAAQSFGAERHGRASAAQTTIASTSFFPAKPLGCFGDGGALFTDDDALAAKMRAIRNHGGEQRNHHTCIGLNGRIDTLQCAVLLAKLPHYDDEIAARQWVAARYGERLEDVCEVPTVAGDGTSVWAQYTIRVPQRDAVQEALGAAGIPSAVYYPCGLHQQPVFRDLGCGGRFPVTEQACAEVISLPMHPFLTDEEIEAVCAGVRQAVSGVAT